LFHTDAVQSFGKLPINLDGIDLLSISGHKLNGLRGTGVLYVKKGVQIDPLFVGGEQEFNLRSGTENLAGNASLARAMRLTLEKEFKRYITKDATNLFEYTRKVEPSYYSFFSSWNKFRNTYSCFS